MCSWCKAAEFWALRRLSKGNGNVCLFVQHWQISVDKFFDVFIISIHHLYLISGVCSSVGQSSEAQFKVPSCTVLTVSTRHSGLIISCLLIISFSFTPLLVSWIIYVLVSALTSWVKGQVRIKPTSNRFDFQPPEFLSEQKSPKLQ